MQHRLAAIRARGRHGGRPRVMTERKVTLVRTMRTDEGSMLEIPSMLGVLPATVHWVLAQEHRPA